MEQLDVPDLVRSGAVCGWWRAASAAVRRARFPLPSSAQQLPCLFYACKDCSPAASAAVHCPFTGESVRVPFPLAPVAGHAVVGAGHGWVVTADENSNLLLFNPITGAQASLPPITGIRHVETVAGEARRDCIYHRVVLSRSPSSAGPGACVALMAHMSYGELSFARLGDERWTSISPDEHPHLGRSACGFGDFFHDDDDGIFYALRFDGSICTLDLNGDSPVVKQITGRVPPLWFPPTVYILRAPWGDILQVRRWRRYFDLVDDDGLKPITRFDELVNPYRELRTVDIEVLKVDFDRRSAVKMSSLDDHALFLGYNTTMCLSTKDYPMLKPNCAYITDDTSEYIGNRKNGWREIGIWDMKAKSLQRFECAEDSPPWLNWPTPVWIKPSF
uniref:KIB1-4 beta-propeller domain-containing protein n=1 Tax=Oryza brachyantha TaxID=4533 RepID=J3LBW0_ORYBR